MIYTYGVDAPAIQARIQDVKISATTSPSLTDLDLLVADCAALVNGEAIAVGVDPSISSADEPVVYQILRGMVIVRTCAEFLRARGRGSDSGWQSYMKDYAERLDTLRGRTEAIQERAGGPNRADRVYRTGTDDDRRLPGLAGTLVSGGTL
jgi:hypothetical protein